MYLTAEQFDYLLQPLRGVRVAKRKLYGNSGPELSYLEAWDVKAHLTRVFGFGNWDSETVESSHIATQEYVSAADKSMVEVSWMARVRLTVRTYEPASPLEGELLPQPYYLHTTSYSETAVGSAAGSRDGAGLGDLHDNAVKQAASDALKRCAINLGTQFGLSLYDDGNKTDVVRVVLMRPQGATMGTLPQAASTKEVERTLAESLGARPEADQ